MLVAEDLDLGKEPVEDEEYEYLQFYGFKLQTEKGDVVIEYRNSSNGYYGGDLVWPPADGEDSDYFYGGVFDQNVSKEEWEQIV